MIGSSRKVRAIEREFDDLRLRLTAAESSAEYRNDALVYILTARTRGEGVSTVCAGLARSFARSGAADVLLLDANGQPSHAKAGGPPSRASEAPNGLAEDLDAAIQFRQDWGVHFLPLLADGRRPPSGGQWEDYVSGLRARYDVIVVDAGALDGRAPYEWSEKANHVLLVVDSNRTGVLALERLRKDLEVAKMTITGIVLNKREYPVPELFY